METDFVERQWEEGNDLYVRLTVAQAHIRNGRVIAFVPLHGDEIKIQLSPAMIKAETIRLRGGYHHRGGDVYVFFNKEN